MPATGVRFTMFLRDDAYGISETHTLSGASTTQGAYAAALALFKRRMKIAGYGVSPVGGRLSLETIGRNSQIINPVDFAGLAPTQFNYATINGQPETNNTDQAKACALLRCEANNVHRKSLFLAGIPDVIIQEEPTSPPIITAPQWGTDFNAYVRELTTKGWGFVCRADANGANARQPVLSLLTQAGTNLVGVVTGGGGPAYVATQKIQLAGFTRTNVAFASLNGIWQIASVAAGPGAGQATYYLAGTAGISVGTVFHVGTIQAVDYQTLSYANVYLLSPSTRKRGNRFLVSPGRRKIRKPLPL